MPEVFATTLSLRPLEGRSSQEAYIDALRAWVGARWPHNTPWINEREPLGFRAPDGSIFRWDPFIADDSVLLEFTWRHNHVDNPSVSWSTRALLYGASGTPSLSLRVSNTGPEIGQPGCLTTTRPRLILELLSRFSCTQAGQPCAVYPRMLADTDCADFVDHGLCDPDRKLPILLLSPHANGHYEIQADQFAREFASLGELFVLRTPDASYALTNNIGSQRLSCFHGALRLYMPSFLRTDPEDRHPLVFPNRLRQPQSRLQLAHYLARVQAADFREDHAVHILRDERAVAIETRRRQMLDSMTALQTAAEGVDVWKQIVGQADEEIRLLRSTVSRLEDDLRAAENKVNSLTYALNQVRGSEPQSEETTAEEFDPDDVHEAVEFAQSIFFDDLEILPSALDSARESPFSRPHEVWAALRACANVARRKKTGPLGKSMRDAFAELGQDYAGGISQTSSRQIRDQHRFSNGSETFQCEEHLRLGSAYDPAHTLRIYFTSTPESSDRFVIGHVGRHLDGMSTT